MGTGFFIKGGFLNESKKLIDQTNERFIWMFNEFVKDLPLPNPSKPHPPKMELCVFTEYYNSILAFATLAAVSSYHDQLREELKRHGIDIGEFTYPDLEEFDSDL